MVNYDKILIYHSWIHCSIIHILHYLSTLFTISHQQHAIPINSRKEVTIKFTTLPVFSTGNAAEAQTCVDGSSAVDMSERKRKSVSWACCWVVDFKSVSVAGLHSDILNAVFV